MSDVEKVKLNSFSDRFLQDMPYECKSHVAKLQSTTEIFFGSGRREILDPSICPRDEGWQIVILATGDVPSWDTANLVMCAKGQKIRLGSSSENAVFFDCGALHYWFMPPSMFRSWKTATEMLRDDLQAQDDKFCERVFELCLKTEYQPEGEKLAWLTSTKLASKSKSSAIASSPTPLIGDSVLSPIKEQISLEQLKREVLASAGARSKAK